MQFWYNEQLRRYRSQFIRIFNNFYVRFGANDVHREPQYVKVPCRYGDPSRISEVIVHGNSENKILSAPFITCIINHMELNPNRRQDPTLVEQIAVNEREYDTDTDRYLDTPGNRYTVERYMSVPYDLTMQVDIWTSNLDQKEQILEQILTIFNPQIDLQTSNSPLDLAVLTYVELTDINWSSRSVPIGTDNPIDVVTLTFKYPIWLNPPAKVKRQHVIQQIITTVYNGTLEDDVIEEWAGDDFLTAVATTPGQYTINVTFVNANTYSLSLMQPNAAAISNTAWSDLFTVYGTLETFSNVGTLASTITLNNGNLIAPSNTMQGFIDTNPTDPTSILWVMNTASFTTTLPPVNAVINPQLSFPGGSLPSPASGQRYLIIGPISDQSVPWGTVIANENDIIEFNGTQWEVSFNSLVSGSTQTVTSQFNGKIYEFTDDYWAEIMQPYYAPGLWTINI
jgi:hypothetical protein